MIHENSFSIQLKGKESVKNVCLTDGSEVLFEGYMGQLESLEMIDESIIEIQGSKGVLRFDLKKDQLLRLVKSMEERRKNE
jgi:hypothetical protein